MKRKEIFRLMFPAAAFAGMVLLASCSADELNSGGGSTVVPPTGETVSSGTVNFTNNTSMTIGNGSITEGTTRTAWMTRGASFDFDGNEACKLEMPAEPTLSGDETVLTEGGVLGHVGVNSVIPEGVTYTSEKENGIYINSDLYVKGTLNLNTYVFEYSYSGNPNPIGRIIICKGGTLNINDLKNHAIEDVQILNYGGTVTVNCDLTIDSDAEFATTTDLDMQDNSLTVSGGKLYVGGDLTCSRLASETGGALIHVQGDFTAEANFNDVGNYPEDGSGQIEIASESDVCIEGVTNVYRLMASRAANVHTDCKLIAADVKETAINITNGATLCASYVEAGTLHVSGGGSGTTANVYLSDGGVMNISNQLSVGNAKILPYNSGKALVAANIIYIEDQKAWTDIFDPTLYINYETIDPESEKPEDTTLHNVAEIGTAGECSPGFTIDEPEDPDTPTGDGDIELEIDLGIDEEYTLKADDFAIRVNGKYDEITVDGNNTATALNNIKITEDDLRVIVSGITEAIQDDQDYTFEVWIWVDNAKEFLREDGSGLTEWRELFDENKKLEWVGGQPGADKDPYGEDISKDYVTVISSPAGYHVRYNVYRGISGNPDASHENVEMLYPLGDTPYVKVSVHVQKRDSSPANDAVPVYEPLDEIPEP